MLHSIYQNPKPGDLSLQFNLIENTFEGADKFKSELILTNNGYFALRNNWTIYFNFLRLIFPDSVSQGFQIQHINGDFFSLHPTHDFSFLSPGKSLKITFVAQYWIIKTNDAPAGFYIIFNDNNGEQLQPEPINDYKVGIIERIEQTQRNNEDRISVPTVLSRFNENAQLQLLPADSLIPILPTPVKLKKIDDYYTMPSVLQLAFDERLVAEAAFLKSTFKEELALDIVFAEDKNVEIRLIRGDILMENIEKIRNKEAYSLVVSNTGIEITGVSNAAVFYGIQSLRMLISSLKTSVGHSLIRIPVMVIVDFPAFQYRGMHLDISRNFQKLSTVKKMLNLMAMYKLNQFHLHLTDDEGWRIEIPGLPELTEIGGRRGHTLNEKECLMPSFGSGPDSQDHESPANGFYSREEFIDLLRCASLLHIDVIPEIDLPGHAKAAIRAMETRYHRYIDNGEYDKATEFLLTDWDDESEYESVQMWHQNVVNIGLASTYRFLEKIVSEIQEMYIAAGLTLTVVHIGGDEVPVGVWTKSPAIQKLKQAHPELQDAQDLTDYFMTQVIRILNEKKIVVAGWEEIALKYQQEKYMPNPAFLNSHIRPYVWNATLGSGREDLAYKLANSGFQVILANASNLYFDLAYDKDPDEPGYYWGGFINTQKAYKLLPYDLCQIVDFDVQNSENEGHYLKSEHLTISGQNNILGIQGQLWGESIKNAEMLEYLLLPRMLALAERAWTIEPKWAKIKDRNVRDSEFKADWNQFANRLGQIELPRLDKLPFAVRYRIPPPGAKIENGILLANAEFPGLEIRYTANGSEPTEESTLYEHPIEVDGKMIKLKSFSQNGRCSRTSTLINH